MFGHQPKLFVRNDDERVRVSKGDEVTVYLEPSSPAVSTEGTDEETPDRSEVEGS